MDYKNMTDSQLASIMVNYINRAGNLREIIARYIERHDYGSIQAGKITNGYRELKNELRKAADYLKLVQNRTGSQLYTGFFSPSIREAAACGFTVPTNHKIDQQMFGAVSEAYYRLTKYCSLEQWEALM